MELDNENINEVTIEINEPVVEPIVIEAVYPRGPRGFSVLSGAGVPSSSIGVNGDSYLNTSNGDTYLKSSGVWTVNGNIRGATGEQGATGATGAQGFSILSGAGAPTTQGVDGDTYLNTTSGDTYIKSGGTWSLNGNIRGPKGDIATMTTANRILGLSPADTVPQAPKQIEPQGLTLLGDKFYNAIESGSGLSKVVWINNPLGGLYQSASAVTGAIKIKVPYLTGTPFINIIGVISRGAALGGSISFNIGLYPGAMASNYDATIITNIGKYQVRFFTDGSDRYVTMGETNTNFGFLSVIISSVKVSFNTVAEIPQFASGWEISTITSYTGTQSAIQPETLPNPSLVNPITGYNGASGVNTPLLATDTLLAALQNLQKQISSGGGGGSVSSVNSKTGTIVLDTGDIADVSGKRYQTDEQKANNDATSPVQGQLNNKVDKSGTKQLSDENYTTAEKNKLASITAIFTTVLKTAYDSSVTWISTNGANLIAHLSLTNNPHNVTKAQVGLGSTADGATVNSTDATLLNRANHTGTQVQSTVVSLVSDLALKAPIASPTFTGTVGGVTKAMVGLGNVPNTDFTTIKQDTLVSATNIKTINGSSILGSGDLTISGGTPTTDASLLTSGTLADARLSANVPILETVGANKVIKKANLRVTQWGAGIEDYTDVNGESSGKISTSWLDTYIATPLGLKANLASPTFTGTVGGITKSMVGLSSVDNTADTAKPVSTAQQTAINAKVADNLTASTTVAPSKTAVNTGLGLKANIASPTFTGTAAAPTATQGTATTQLATTAFVDVAVKTLLINTPTASYTLVLADAGKNVRMNVATANTLTIPLNATVAFPIGTQLVFKQAGAGQTTLTPISGVTLNSASGLKTRVQHSGGTLIKVGTNEWDVMGDLAI